MKIVLWPLLQKSLARCHKKVQYLWEFLNFNTSGVQAVHDFLSKALVKITFKTFLLRQKVFFEKQKHTSYSEINSFFSTLKIRNNFGYSFDKF